MIQSFQPYVDSQTEILILGTMPGIASLEKQEYYAQNHFWRILYTILNAMPISEIFEEKNTGAPSE
jgi:hypoxanthine-DNA glycosylase